jgi:hypothetical protein
VPHSRTPTVVHFGADGAGEKQLSEHWVRINGSGWGMALSTAAGSARVSAAVRADISVAVGLPESKITITELRVGSLVVTFWASRNSSQLIPDGMINTFMETSALTYLTFAYENITGITNEILSVNQTLTRTSSNVIGPVAVECNGVQCYLPAAIGASGGAVVALVIIVWCAIRRRRIARRLVRKTTADLRSSVNAYRASIDNPPQPLEEVVSSDEGGESNAGEGAAAIIRPPTTLQRIDFATYKKYLFEAQSSSSSSSSASSASAPMIIAPFALSPPDAIVSSEEESGCSDPELGTSPQSATPFPQGNAIAGLHPAIYSPPLRHHDPLAPPKQAAEHVTRDKVPPPPPPPPPPPLHHHHARSIAVTWNPLDGEFVATPPSCNPTLQRQSIATVPTTVTPVAPRNPPKSKPTLPTRPPVSPDVFVATSPPQVPQQLSNISIVSAFPLSPAINPAAPVNATHATCNPGAATTSEVLVAVGGTATTLGNSTSSGIDGADGTTLDNTSMFSARSVLSFFGFGGKRSTASHPHDHCPTSSALSSMTAMEGSLKKPSASSSRFLNSPNYEPATALRPPVTLTTSASHVPFGSGDHHTEGSSGESNHRNQPQEQPHQPVRHQRTNSAGSDVAQIDFPPMLFSSFASQASSSLVAASPLLSLQKKVSWGHLSKGSPREAFILPPTKGSPAAVAHPTQQAPPSPPSYAATSPTFSTLGRGFHLHVTNPRWNVSTGTWEDDALAAPPVATSPSNANPKGILRRHAASSPSSSAESRSIAMLPPLRLPRSLFSSSIVSHRSGSSSTAAPATTAVKPHSSASPSAATRSVHLLNDEEYSPEAVALRQRSQEKNDDIEYVFTTTPTTTAQQQRWDDAPDAAAAGPSHHYQGASSSSSHQQRAQQHQQHLISYQLPIALTATQQQQQLSEHMMPNAARAATSSAAASTSPAMSLVRHRAAAVAPTTLPRRRPPTTVTQASQSSNYYLDNRSTQRFGTAHIDEDRPVHVFADDHLDPEQHDTFQLDMTMLTDDGGGVGSFPRREAYQHALSAVDATALGNDEGDVASDSDDMWDWDWEEVPDANVPPLRYSRSQQDGR